MGWAKYYEDNSEIIHERTVNRVDRAEREYQSWTRDVVRIREMSLKPIVSNTDRYKELLEIKEGLLYKINLSLAVANSLEEQIMKRVINSLTIGFEDSYAKVGKAIRALETETNNTPQISVSKKTIKNSLVKNVFFKVEKIVNEYENLSQLEMDSIMSDLLILIKWFYVNDYTVGNIKLEGATREELDRFLQNEVETQLCSCPICGRKTIEGWKFCIECAREW